MRPIPKRMLIHSAQLAEVSKDEWQNVTLKPLADLQHIRIEPSSKLVTDKQNRQITLSAVLFYDLQNSTPKKVEVSLGQKIVFGGTEYTVETIEPIYDDKKLHHFELGLI